MERNTPNANDAAPAAPRITNRMKTYEIFVSDANGWDEGCPSLEGVFFDPDPEEVYMRPTEGGRGRVGSLLVTGYRAALARLNDLQTTGDWTEYGQSEETRPEYRMREWRGESR